MRTETCLAPLPLCLPPRPRSLLLNVSAFLAISWPSLGTSESTEGSRKKMRYIGHAVVNVPLLWSSSGRSLGIGAEGRRGLALDLRCYGRRQATVSATRGWLTLSSKPCRMLSKIESQFWNALVKFHEVVSRVSNLVEWREATRDAMKGW